MVQQASATVRLPGLANEPATIPSPSSGWRWGLIAVGADGRSRYSPMQRGADGSASLTMLLGDTGLFMIVPGALDTFRHIGWDQPYYSIYRYPWMAQFSGAMPDRYQPGAPEPVAGGQVTDNARVATVFLGIGEYERGIVLSGDARTIGDIEQRGASASRGSFHGFVDPGVVADPQRGATLAAAVPEVTAAPDYRWRD